MPQTFYEYLQGYPEVFSWYCTLSRLEAMDFEDRHRSVLEGGQSVAVQIPQPVTNYLEPPLYVNEERCYLLNPPVDRFCQAIQFPGNPYTLTTQPCWNAVPSRPHRSYTIFVPYHCFKQCTTCLDTPDLRAVLVRTVRVLRYLTEPAPLDYIVAAEKWRNCRQSLVRYGIYCAEEYMCRGGSAKVLEYLKPLVRRREWHKPNWVYDTNELEHQREHLMFCGLRRVVAKTIHQSQSSILQFIRQFEYTRFKDCDETDLFTLMLEIERSQNSTNMPKNFYSQYNWNVIAHRGNFE